MQAKTKKIRTRHNHHKPYLIRHFSLLVAASWLVFVSLFGYGVNQLTTGENPEVLGAQSDTVTDSLRHVVSGNDYTLSYDPELLEASAKVVDAKGRTSELKGVDLAGGRSLDSFVIKARPGKGNLLDASAQLSIRNETGTSPGQSSGTRISRTIGQLGGVDMQKTIYEHTTRLGQTDYKSYSIEWSGDINGHKLIITLEGLQGPSRTPGLLATVLDSLSFNSGGNVLGANTETKVLDASSPYATDVVSPAVVKIYRITCGTLMIEGKPVGGERCEAASGSGFFVSSDGHIATNGHVVNYGPEESLIHLLSESPASLINFLRYIGLSDQQIKVASQRPELMSAIIAKLYDAPSNIISFKDKRSVVLVSLGSHPLRFDTEEQARGALNFQDTDHIKRADNLASNYSAKDLFVVAAGGEQGFSSSDVALIKVKAQNTPFLKLLDGPVAQNQKISILGFPGDADNHLTDNNSLNVTVTNGSINAIRLAAGGRYRLYQSDADASKGSSGGPVIDESGNVLGILTYRFKDESAAASAKSYIRDISDVKKLADDNKLILPTTGNIQNQWTQALDLFSKSRYSKAIPILKQIKNSYPAHRLADTYIQASEQALNSGKDIKDISLPLVVAVSFTGATAAAGAVILIARHHASHRAYRIGSHILGTGLPHAAS